MTVYVLVTETEDGERIVTEYGDDRCAAMAECEALQVRGTFRGAVLAVTPDGEGGHLIDCVTAFENDPVPLAVVIFDAAVSVE